MTVGKGERGAGGLGRLLGLKREGEGGRMFLEGKNRVPRRRCTVRAGVLARSGGVR